MDRNYSISVDMASTLVNGLSLDGLEVTKAMADFKKRVDAGTVYCEVANPEFRNNCALSEDYTDNTCAKITKFKFISDSGTVDFKIEPHGPAKHLLEEEGYRTMAAAWAEARLVGGQILITRLNGFTIHLIKN